MSRARRAARGPPMFTLGQRQGYKEFAVPGRVVHRLAFSAEDF